MKRTLLFNLIIVCGILMILPTNTSAQVGINTTTPQGGSMLDVDSADKGILVPRVNIANLSTIAPITGGATESLLVYNTNTTTGKGFYYWNGSVWTAIESNDWKAAGNGGTTPGVNFLGTTDNVPMSFRTNNTERLRITASGNFRMYNDGTAAVPVMQWASDTDTGFYRAGADQIGFCTGGTERLRFPNANQVFAMASGTSALPFYSFNNDQNTGMFRSGADQLSFSTAGSERLSIMSDGSLRATAAGSSGTPTFSWGADTDTGFFRSTADAFNIVAGGREMVEFLENGGNSAVVFNDNSNNTDLRVETNNDANAFFVDGGNDNIGLGTNTPNTSAQLVMADNDRGILINRVALTSATSASPVTSPATGLLVYNTANSSSGATEVLPGFYYWDGSRWIAMGGTGGKDWGLQGNAGTSLASNFLGTTDATSMSIRTNATERIRVDAGGNIGIASLPYTDTALRVSNSAQPYGVIAETSSNGAAIWGNDTGSGDGVVGISNGGFGTWGQTSASSAVIGGAVALGTATNNSNGMWSLAGARPTSGAAQNIGVRAVSGGFTSISPVGYRTVGLDANAVDLGLYSLTEGPITTFGTLQSALFKTNYTGSNIDSDTRDPQASLAGYTSSSLAGGGNMYYGGFFYSGSSTTSYAYAGATFNGTQYKIIGNGTVSTIVDGANPGDSKKVMFAPEAPEVLFEDYGTGKLVNGVAYIDIDPIFANNIIVDASHPLKVFIQLEGDCNGVFVSNKSAQGFQVKELQSGTSNVPFSWHIVANRKDSTASSDSESSNFSGLRFPDAPDALKPSAGKSNSIEPAQLDQKPTVAASNQAKN